MQTPLGLITYSLEKTNLTCQAVIFEHGCTLEGALQHRECLGLTLHDSDSVGLGFVLGTESFKSFLEVILYAAPILELLRAISPRSQFSKFRGGNPHSQLSPNISLHQKDSANNRGAPAV